jgi:hypothetical protein
MITSRINPISVKGLWENCWVFALYGLFLGLAIGSMAILKVDLAKVESLMMEPLSFYVFSTLSLIGLLGLGIINLTTAKSAEAMYSSAWVMRFWVPIANTGLSTGAIVTGMMFGLAIGLLPWAFEDDDLQRLVQMLFAMSVLVFAILYPLTWMKRSLFDLTKKEENISVIAGVFYCFVLVIAFWFIDQQIFWGFLLFIAALSLVMMKISKRD